MPQEQPQPPVGLTVPWHGPADGALWIDRSAEAERVRLFVEHEPARLLVLYGKRGIGKTQLVQREVLPRLSQDHAAFYVDGGLSLTPQLGEGGGDRLWAAAGPEDIVFVDNAEKLLEGGNERRGFLHTALSRVTSDGGRCKLVLIVNDDQLRSLFALRAEAPEIVDHALEIDAIDLQQGLAALVPRTGFAAVAGVLAPPVLQADRAFVAAAPISLAGQVGGVSVSPDLLRIIDSQLRLSPSATLVPADLDMVIWDYLRGRLESIPEVGLSESLRFETGFAILEQVVAAGGSSSLVVDFDEVARRAGVTEADCSRVLEHLKGADSLVREVAGRLVLVPAELATAVIAESKRREASSRDAGHLIDQAAPGWQANRSPLPQRAFKEVQRQRRALRLQRDEIELVFYSSLLWDKSPELKAALYWLHRLPNCEMAVNVLASALLHVSAQVRGRAAGALGEIPHDTARDLLQTLALGDPDREVRQRAIDGLARAKTEDLRDRLLNEVHSPASLYRRHAIEALRIFDDAVTIRSMRRFADDLTLPLRLRHAALETLASLQTAAAADSLVEIALTGVEREVRQQAAAELAGSVSVPMLRQAFAALRAKNVESAPAAGWPVPTTIWWPVGRVSLAIVLVVANALVHGLILLLQRRRLGLALLGIEVTGAALLFSGGSVAVGMLLLVSSFVLGLSIGQLLPLRVILDAGNRRIGIAGSGNLGMALWVASLPVFFCIHGLAQLVARRPWRQAAASLSLELGSILLMILPALDRGAPNLSVDPFTIFLQLYAALGAVLFLWSFVSAVSVVPQKILLGSRLEAAARQDELCTRLVRNPLWVRELVEALASTDPAEAVWARSLLSRHGDRADVETLVAAVLGTSGPRPEVIRALARAKDDDAVRVLAAAWETAKTETREAIIKVLLRHPKEESLAALRGVSLDLSLAQKVRRAVAEWHFRIRVWPLRVVVGILLALPLVGMCCYQAYKYHRNPAWPQLRMITDRLAPKERRKLDADYVARAQPDKSVRELASVLADSREDADLRTVTVRALSVIASSSAPSEASDQAIQAIVSALSSAMPAEVRQEVLFHLPGILASAGARTEKDFVKKVSAILASSQEDIDLRRSALSDLVAIRTPRAIAELRDFVALGKATSRVRVPGIADASEAEIGQREQDLRIESIRELSKIGTLDAAVALDQLHIKPLAPPLQQQVALARVDPLRGAKDDYSHRRFQVAIDKARTFLAPEAPPLTAPAAPAALALIGQSYYQLARSQGPGSGSATWWVQEAISFLTQAREAGARDEDLDHALARAYVYSALPAVRGGQGGPKDQAAGNAAAEHSLRAAIELEPEGPASGLLVQLLHQEHADLRGEADFRQLQQRFPRSSGIATALAVIESEYLSAGDPRAFENAYQALMRTLVANPMSENDLILRVDLAEAEITTGRYLDAAQHARRLLARTDLSGGGLGAELSMYLRLLLYLSQVLSGDSSAGRELDGFGKAYRQQAGDLLGWQVGGLTRYIQQSGLPQRQRETLLALVALVPDKRPQAEVQRALALNHAILPPLTRASPSGKSSTIRASTARP